ncbi:MAG: glycosyl hydrolase family 18 protein [Flavobacteriaceae bacterium]|nr:glycosyl hydrolase family 18 protein [Flavobacteriaceae bacterium]
MINSRTIFVIVMLGALVFSSCRRQSMQLRSSVRRTQNDVRYFNRDVSQVKNLLGIETEETADPQDSTSKTLFTPVDQKNIFTSYGYVYDAINGSKDVINSSNFYWDSIQKVYYVRNKKYSKIKPENEVFGWHPYWMGSAWESYPFELLSTISYFSYKLDPNTGSYTNPKQMNEWRNTAMIDSAKLKKTKVLLTVSSHGYANNNSFLGDQAKWGVMIDSVSVLLLERDADGVDINFENLPYLKRGSFNRFIEELRKRLNQKFGTKTPVISLTLPAVDSREIFDVQDLQKFVDLFVIMGYDYNTGPQLQGAVAPLIPFETKNISLNNTLKYYLEAGIDPSKTVLALPYYGSMWEGTLGEGGSTSSMFERKVTYREVRSIFNDEFVTKNNLSPILEKNSMTNYFNITYPDNTTKEVWFDDDYTLGKKYDFAITNNLKGIGIWALGYDNGYNELWDVIETKFATDAVPVVDPVGQIEGYPIKVSNYILKKKDLLLVSSLFFLFAVAIGFVLALSDWKVRDSIVKNQFHRFIMVMIIFIFLTPIIYLVNELFFLKSTWKYYAVFILGGLTIYLSSFLKIKSTKRP